MFENRVSKEKKHSVESEDEGLEWGCEPKPIITVGEDGVHILRKGTGISRDLRRLCECIGRVG